MVREIGAVFKPKTSSKESMVSFSLLHGDASAKKRREGNDLHAFKTAGINHIIIRKLGSHVEGEP